MKNRGLLVVGVVLATATAAPAPADARTERKTAWTAEQVWPAAVRFIRLDERLTILDRDADTGYVLFEQADGDGKVHTGSLELVTSDDKVRVVITISSRPPYIELGMLDRLEKKLRTELGAPPQAGKPAS